MKQIIDNCEMIQQSAYNDDKVKLRLRGQGSGYKEGPEELESEDSLHLCVSSSNKQKYDHACQEVENLLKGIYKQY